MLFCERIKLRTDLVPFSFTAFDNPSSDKNDCELAYSIPFSWAAHFVHKSCPIADSIESDSTAGAYRRLSILTSPRFNLPSSFSLKSTKPPTQTAVIWCHRFASFFHHIVSRFATPRDYAICFVISDQPWLCTCFRNYPRYFSIELSFIFPFLSNNDVAFVFSSDQPWFSTCFWNYWLKCDQIAVSLAVGVDCEPSAAEIARVETKGRSGTVWLRVRYRLG